ncbi:MAG: daptide biosynthesis RiPP recognition protein, partial [Microbacterium sp.]
VDPTSRRRFRLGVDAARAAECLIATADESSASALLAAELGRRAGSATDVVHEVRGRFVEAGVDLTSYGWDGE